MVLFENYQSLEQNQPTTRMHVSKRSKDITHYHWKMGQFINRNTPCLVPNLPITWPPRVPEKITKIGAHQFHYSSRRTKKEHL